MPHAGQPKFPLVRLTQEALRLIDGLKVNFRKSRIPLTFCAWSLCIRGIPKLQERLFAIATTLGRRSLTIMAALMSRVRTTMDGISGYGTWDRLSGYFRGEYQQSGSRYRPIPPMFNTSSQAVDQTPIPSASQHHSANRFDAIEAYVGAQISRTSTSRRERKASGGGPEKTAHSISATTLNLCICFGQTQTTPIVLPGPLRFLGRIRTQFLLGRLTGHEFPPRPWINAQKITFQLTPDFEFGFTRSAIFGGRRSSLDGCQLSFGASSAFQVPAARPSVPRMTQATAAAALISDGTCRNSDDTSLFTLTRWPMMNQIRSMLHGDPLGDPAFTSPNFPACEMSIFGSRLMQLGCTLRTMAASSFIGTISITTRTQTTAMFSEVGSDETAARTSRPQRTGSPRKTPLPVPGARRKRAATSFPAAALKRMYRYRSVAAASRVAQSPGSANTSDTLFLFWEGPTGCCGGNTGHVLPRRLEDNALRNTRATFSLRG